MVKRKNDGKYGFYNAAFPTYNQIRNYRMNQKNS